MANKLHYRYLEDNGGGLHMVVYNDDGKALHGVTNLEYAEAGEWNLVKDSLDADPLSEATMWEGYMEDIGVDPQTVLDDDSYKIVCEDGKLFTEQMGTAARIYFDIEE